MALETHRIQGAPHWLSLRSQYHQLPKRPWGVVITAILVMLVLVHVAFALVYRCIGGVDGLEPTLLAAFFFSVETMHAIGYGVANPTSAAAHWVVTIQSMVGLLFTAIATGLVFVRFTHTREQLRIAVKACIGMVDGERTFMVQMANSLASPVFGAKVQIAVLRDERTREGFMLLRSRACDVELGSNPLVARSWTVLHRIDAKSPMAAFAWDSSTMGDARIVVSVTGTDEVSLQPVHAVHTYTAADLVLNARPASVLTRGEDGVEEVDLRRLDDVVQMTP